MKIHRAIRLRRIYATKGCIRCRVWASLHVLTHGWQDISRIWPACDHQQECRIDYKPEPAMAGVAWLPRKAKEQNDT